MFGTVSDDFINDRVDNSIGKDLSQGYEASYWEGVSSAFKQSWWDDTTAGAYIRKRELDLADYDYSEELYYSSLFPEEKRKELEQRYQDKLLQNPIIDGEEFTELTHEGMPLSELGIKFEDGHRRDYWNERANLQYNRLQREQTITESEIGGVSRFAAGMGAQVFDPINLIPLGGGALATKGMTGAAKYATAAGVGALEAGAGNLATDLLFVKPAYEAEDIEYTAKDVLVNTAIGTVVGAGFGAGGAAIRSKWFDDVSAGKEVNTVREFREFVNDNVEGAKDVPEVDPIPAPRKRGVIDLERVQRLSRRNMQHLDDPIRARREFLEEVGTRMNEERQRVAKMVEEKRISKNQAGELEALQTTLSDDYKVLTTITDNVAEAVRRTELEEPTMHDITIENLKTKLMGPLNTSEESKLIENIYNYILKRYRKSGNMEMVLNDFHTQQGLNLFVEMRNSTLQKLRVGTIMGELQKFSDAHPARNLAEGLYAKLGGSSWDIAGAANSVDTQMKGMRAKYLSAGLMRDLKDSGLYKLFQSADEQFEFKIAKELWDIDGKTGKAAKSTGDDAAATIAEIIHKWQYTMVQELNDAGANIRWLPGYITRQSHDPKRLLGLIKRRDVINNSDEYKAVMNEWRNTIKQHLDFDKTFDDPTIGDEDIDDILEEVYRRLVTGKHLTGKGEKRLGKTLAERLGAHRKLHFKSAEDWFTYNQKYGRSRLFKSIVKGFDHGSKNLTLMRNFGADPEGALDQIITRIKFLATEGDVKSQKELTRILGKSEGKIRALFAELTGEASIVANERGAAAAAGIRMFHNMTSLGSASISAIADAPLFRAQSKRMGIPLTKMVNQFVVKDFLGNKFMSQASKEVREEVANKIGIGVDGMLSDFLGRFTMNDALDGESLLAKAHNRFFWATGLEQWTNAHKKGWGYLMSSHMADQMRKSWDELSKVGGLRDELMRYGFTEKDWKQINKAKTTNMNGNKFLLPEDIIDKELREKYRAFIIDSGDTAVITPGAKERAFMHMGLQPGTIAGEAARFFWQFKSFPLTLYTRVQRTMLRRGRAGGGWSESKAQVAKNLAAMAAIGTSMTIFGGISSDLKDITRGRKPRVSGAFMNEDKRTQALSLAMLQGGAASVFGDVLFGLGQDYGGAGGAEFFGPAAANIIEGGQILVDPFTGDYNQTKNIWYLKNNIPFQNWFVTRGVMDSYFTYTLLEASNPGYLADMENKYIEKYRTDYYLWPTDTAIRF